MARAKGGLTGDKELLKELKALERKAPGAVARALYQQGVAVLGNAIRRAPVQFGVLRSSGYVAPPQEEGGHAVVEVGFGTVYAAVQHEREDFEHPRGGEAKYLEKAVASEASPQRLAALARENLARGLTSPVLPGAPPKKPIVKDGVRKRALARQRKKRAKDKERARRRAERRTRKEKARKAKERGALLRERKKLRRAGRREAKRLRRRLVRAAKAQRRYDARQRKAEAKLARRQRKSQARYERRQRLKQRKAEVRQRRRQRKAEASQRRKEKKRIAKLNRKMRKDLARLSRKRKGTKKAGRRRRRNRKR